MHIIHNVIMIILLFLFFLLEMGVNFLIQVQIELMN